MIIIFSVSASNQSLGHTYQSLTLTLCTEKPKMGSGENSEDPNEMSQNAAFHKSLLCLLWQKNLEYSS